MAWEVWQIMWLRPASLLMHKLVHSAVFCKFMSCFICTNSKWCHNCNVSLQHVVDLSSFTHICMQLQATCTFTSFDRANTLSHRSAVGVGLVVDYSSVIYAHAAMPQCTTHPIGTLNSGWQDTRYNSILIQCPEFWTPKECKKLSKLSLLLAIIVTVNTAGCSKILLCGPISL